VSHRDDVHHIPGTPQRWPHVDSDIHAWVESVVAGTGEILGGALVGVYLHGSLAMGCYYRPKSDLDLLAVSGGVLTVSERREVAGFWLEASDRRPTIGDLEASVISRPHAESFRHPSPYEVHFGSDLAEAVRSDTVDYGRDEVDEDLAAHITVLRARGVALAGPDADGVFGPVPPEDYLAAIEADLDWILDGPILESPVYAVLNACRVLMVRNRGAGTVPDKEEAGVWALGFAPDRHLPLIGQCLDCYRSSAEVTLHQRRTHGHGWDERAVLAFRDWCRRWR
jgi:streptomycin 3"-adenylyltransferase